MVQFVAVKFHPRVVDVAHASNLNNRFLIDCLQLGLDPPLLRGADRNLVFHHGEKRINIMIIIKSLHLKSHPANGNQNMPYN